MIEFPESIMARLTKEFVHSRCYDEMLVDKASFLFFVRVCARVWLWVRRNALPSPVSRGQRGTGREQSSTPQET